MISKQYLISSASEIQMPDSLAALEYHSKIQASVHEVNTLLLARADLDQLIGAGNRDMMQNNHINHARFVSSVFQSFNAEVLVETILWVFRTYQNHGFHASYWPAQLDAWTYSLKRTLSQDAFEQVKPFYDWMIVNTPVFDILKNHDPESV